MNKMPETPSREAMAETHLSNEGLAAAIKNGQLETVKIYVQNNVTWLTASLTADGNTALHVAAANPYTQILHYIVQTLQAHDLNVFQQQLNQADRNGYTALMRSTRYAPEQDMRYLLEQGASVNAQNKDNNSAMHFAVFVGSQKKIDILLEYGADLSLKNTNGDTAQDMVLPNQKKNLLRTKIKSLEDAIWNSIEKKVPFDLQPFVTYWPLFTISLNAFGQTILHLLPHVDKCNRILGRVLDMLKTHMSPSALHTLINQYDSDGLTPLHNAVEAGKYAILNSAIRTFTLLLDYGADIDAPTLQEYNEVAKGSTALHWLTRLSSWALIKFLIERHVNLQIKDAQGWRAHEISPQLPGKNAVLMAAKSVLYDFIEQPGMAIADIGMRTVLARQSNFASMLEIVLTSDYESDQKERHELLARVVLVAPFEYLCDAASKLSMLLKTECNLSLDSNDVDALCQNLTSFLNSQLESSQDKARVQLFLADLVLYLHRTTSTHEQQKFQLNYAVVQTLLTKLIDDVDAVHTHAPVVTDMTNVTPGATNDRSSSAESGQPQAKRTQAVQLAINFCRAVTAQTPAEYILAQFMLINIYQHQNSDEAYSTHAALVAFAADHKDILIGLAIEFGLADALQKLASDIPIADPHKKLLYFALTRRCISKEIRSQILQTLIANDVSFNLADDNDEFVWTLDLPAGESNELKKSYKKLLTALRTGDMQTVKVYAEQNLNWIKDSLCIFPGSVITAIKHDQRDVFTYLVKALGWFGSVPKGHSHGVVIDDKQHWVNHWIWSAIERDAIDVFHYLVAQGADLTIKKNFSEETTLHCAVRFKSNRIITALVHYKPALLIANNRENKLAIQINHHSYYGKFILPMNHSNGTWGSKDALNKKADTLIRAIQRGDATVVARYAQEAIYWLFIPLTEFKKRLGILLLLPNKWAFLHSSCTAGSNRCCRLLHKAIWI